MIRNDCFMGRRILSFLVDGEFKSWQESAATAFSRFPEGSDLDMRRCLPGRLVGLAASLRSMPTALTRVLKPRPLG